MDFEELLKKFESHEINLPEPDTFQNHALVNPDFVNYFLEYLRISTDHFLEDDESAEKLTSDVSTTQNIGSIKQRKQLQNGSQQSFQKMSTPKGHNADCIISPMRNLSTATPKFKANNLYKNSPKHKAKLAVTVSDFLNESLMTRSLPRNKKQNKNKAKMRRSMPHDLKQIELSQATRAITFNIKDSEDFPQLNTPKSEGSKKAATRRIKPTTVPSTTITPIKFASHIAENSVVQTSFNDSSFFVRSSNQSDLGKENISLDLLSVVSDSQTSELPNISPVKREESAVAIKFPDPKTATELDKIERLCNLYFFYIETFLVPSLVVEFYFIVQLLSAAQLATHGDATHNSTFTGSMHRSNEHFDNVFSSPPNAIFFCVFMLERLSRLKVIEVLGRSSTMLLVDNPCIKMFSPSLHCTLQQIVLDSKNNSTDQDTSVNKSTLLTSGAVPFEVETDNRSNYANDQAFHSFRKQRDMFYSIIRDYEKSRTDFKSTENIREKIISLISIVKSNSTFKPFSRLFIGQLLLVIGDNVHATTFDLDESETNDVLLKSLKQKNPDKLRLLQSRFSTSKTQSFGFCSFPKSSFFKEFIETTDSYLFIVHLKNEIESRINDFESQHSLMHDNIEGENYSKSTISKSLSKLIISLHLLSKFYGYLSFHPYTDPSLPIPQSTNELAFAENCVKNSMSKGHIIITVPWVSEFATYAQSTFVGSNHFKSLLNHLLIIYRFQNGSLNSNFCALVSSCIGRVFERHSTFIEHFYKLSKECEQQYSINSSTLDSVCEDFVDLSLISDLHHLTRSCYNCLFSCNRGVVTNKDKTTTRKIKPSSADAKTNLLQINKLQCTLEDHFFKGQPASLKRTVLFVAERCSSNCVKFIRSQVMLDVCDEAETIYKENMNNEKTLLEKKSQTNEISTLFHAKLKSDITRIVDEFCNNNVSKCMLDLSSCETSPQVLQLATEISTRQAIANTMTWLKLNLQKLTEMSIKSRISKINQNKITEDKKIQYKEISVIKTEEVDPIKIQSYSHYLHMVKEILYVHSANKGDMHTIDKRVMELSRQNHVYLLQAGEALLHANHQHDLCNFSENEDVLKEISTLIQCHVHLHNAMQLIVTQLRLNLFPSSS